MSGHDEVLGIVERFATARRWADELLVAHPGDPAAFNAAAEAYSSAGAHERAFDCFERAHKLSPDTPDYVFNLGVVAQHLGRFDESEIALRRAMDLAPGAAKIYHQIVHLRTQTPEKNLIEPLESLFSLPALDELSRLFAGHALAKSYEDIGEYDQAFSWLENAKSERRMSRIYSRADDEHLAHAAYALVGSSDDGYGSDEPIFVVGMPRTGTSLVDRILSSHSSVTSVGELNNFAQLMTAMAGSRTGRALDVGTFALAATVDVRALGQAYIDSTRPISGQTPHFIDKMPLNYVLSGLILRALPRARIICVVRDPMDACLSLYRQFFATTHPYYDFAYDIANTARAYAVFLNVAQHWRSTLPSDRFHIVRYEDIVANLRSEARTLLEFCGLSWEDACADFHKNPDAITTPSGPQVRLPLYATSVGRWRRYGARLDPARLVFEEEGLSLMV